MTDAKTYINEINFPKTIGKIEVEGSVAAPTAPGEINDKLTGKLEVKDYLNLTEIKLSEHELEEVVIINCPNLEKIDVSDNKLTKFDITRAKTTDDTDTGNPA